MAHFAEIDDSNTVIRVVVVNDDDCLNADGQECEATGSAFCENLFGGTWVQTSYNGNFRGRFAGPGMTYDPDLDEFLRPV